MTSAIVVGAGPNGLAAAVRLASHGIDVEVLEAAATIGGGTKTSELTVPGVLHDHCSAVHPMAVGSPYLASLGLERHGLRWRWTDIDCAHPLDSGMAGVLWQSIDETASGMGQDGARWQRLFGKPTQDWDHLDADVMRPLLHVPAHPLRLARFGLPTLLPATTLARYWKTEPVRALFGGVAAHTFHPLQRPGTSAVAMGIITAGHRHGWAVAEGGSRRITDALAARLVELGGRISTGITVTDGAELAHADIVMFDTTPAAIVRILGDRLPARVARAYGRFRHGPAAFKVDFAIYGGVPWRNESCRLAGTVHLGGTFDEIAATERDIAAGRMPERPFVLVGQQYLADATRSNGSVHPLWTYAHVPNGYTGDATEAIISQIERFAPGFRDHIVATVVTPTSKIAAANANFVGGDIVSGMNSLRQLVLRPRPAIDPYSTGVPGRFLCSAASPPGAGAHGMCGYHAAGSALRHLGVKPSTLS